MTPRIDWDKIWSIAVNELFVEISNADKIEIQKLVESQLRMAKGRKVNEGD